MANNQLQDIPPTNAFQVDYDQLMALENMTLEAKKELLEDILKSYTMGNSMQAAVMMMDAAGEVQGDTAAQFGAINEIDSDLGNVNADGQNMMSAITSYLEGLIPSGGGGTNAPAYAALQAIQKDLGSTPPNYSDIQTQITTLQNYVQNDSNMPPTIQTDILNDLNVMQQNANPSGNMAAFGGAMCSVLGLLNYQANPELQQIIALVAALQPLLQAPPNNPPSQQLMDNLNTAINNLQAPDLAQLKATLTGDYNQLESCYSNWNPVGFNVVLKEMQNSISQQPTYAQWNLQQSSQWQALTQDLYTGNWKQLSKDAATLVNSINQNAFGTLNAQLKTQLLGDLATIQMNCSTNPPNTNLIDAAMADMYYNLDNGSGTNPSAPVQPDYSQIIPKMQEFIDDLTEMAAFINAHQDRFAGGSGTTILNEIQTIQGVFGASWNNPTAMCQQVNTWLQQANSGTTPQQIQTLTAAAQSIDRSTSALSSSSRISLDYKTNQYKQIIGDEESSIQTLLQGIIGFIHNQKNS